jgi:tellurite resistance protein
MSYGSLVQRFGSFVRERHESYSDSVAPSPFPDALQAEREIISHHLIVLSLLARSDGEFADSEQRAIVAHCLSLLERIGVKPSASDRATLENYVAVFRPSLIQLDPALKRLEKDSPLAIASLLCAARKVMEADGESDPAEVKLLDELRAELANH